MTYLWATLAGMLTLINPCVLPLLPIILASSLQQGRGGPLALAGGLVLSFVLIGTGVTAFGHLIGLDTDAVNRIAAGLMVAFGAVLLCPPLQARLATAAGPLAGAADRQLAGHRGEGIAGQFGIGLLLGAVWSPCVGPTLGGAIGLAASGLCSYSWVSRSGSSSTITPKPGYSTACRCGCRISRSSSRTARPPDGGTLPPPRNPLGSLSAIVHQAGRTRPSRPQPL